MSDDSRKLSSESKGLALSVRRNVTVYEPEKPDHWPVLTGSGANLRDAMSVMVWAIDRDAARAQTTEHFERTVAKTLSPEYSEAYSAALGACDFTALPSDSIKHWVMVSSGHIEAEPARGAGSLLREYARQMVKDPKKVRDFFAKINDRQAAG